MRYKKVNSLSFTSVRYPAVVKKINQLAQLEGKAAHEVGEALILRFGEVRLIELLNRECEKCEFFPEECVNCKKFKDGDCLQFKEKEPKDD